MADDTKAKTEPVTDTPAAPVPSADQKTPDQPVVDEVASQKVASPTDKQPDQTLPDGASERTQREFDKLRTQLREERARREYVENVFQQLTPKQPEVTPIVDPDTGLPREEALNDLQRRTIQAEQTADLTRQQMQDYLVEQENREAFAVHPELDPNSKQFDKNLHVETRRILLDSMMNPDDYNGRQLSFKEAADIAKSNKPTDIEAARKQGAQEALEQLTPKEQAALEAVGNPGRRSDVASNLDDLRARSRKGDMSAVIERLKAQE